MIPWWCTKNKNILWVWVPVKGNDILFVHWFLHGLQPLMAPFTLQGSSVTHSCTLTFPLHHEDLISSEVAAGHLCSGRVLLLHMHKNGFLAHHPRFYTVVSKLLKKEKKTFPLSIWWLVWTLVCSLWLRSNSFTKSKEHYKSKYRATAIHADSSF